MRSSEEQIILPTETQVLYKRLLSAWDNSQYDIGYGDVRKAFQILAKSSLDRNIADQRVMDFGLELATMVLSDLGLGQSSILASMLYSSLISGEVTEEKIRELFGEEVARLSSELSKISSLSVNDSIHQAENFRHLMLSLVTDIRVILIKIAERLCLLRRLNAFEASAKDKFVNDTFYLFAPLAHRLGLYNIKSEMEDRALQHIQPEAYKMIEAKMAEGEAARKAFIQEFVAPIESRMKEEGLEFVLKSRTKSIYSIYNKMVKQKVIFEEVYDIFAIRLILKAEEKKEKPACWHAYSIVTDLYKPNTSRLRDWISVPKSNGYESLHITVMHPSGKWVEVQIRTARMDEIAEKGLAAHWKYKGGKSSQSIEQTLAQIRDSLAENEAESKEQEDKADINQRMKLSLDPKEVFIFTPNGDLKKMQKGSTVLDFAFSIHSDIGVTCVGAKINERNVSIRYVLQNGDTVRILTSKNQRPNADWLNFVSTSKARNKIKTVLKEEERKLAEQGKELLERRLKNWKIPLTDEVLKILLHISGVKAYTDAFVLIANNKVNLLELRHMVRLEQERKEKQEKKAEIIDEREVGKLAKPLQSLNTRNLLSIDGKIGTWDYKLAKCCNPVYGDPIFAFVSINEGVKIHRDNCPNAAELQRKLAYRILPAEWVNPEKNHLFLSDIFLKGYDKIGLVNQLTEIISRELNTPIRSISLNTGGGLFEGTITVMIADKNQLDVLISRIKKVKGVLSAERRGE